MNANKNSAFSPLNACGVVEKEGELWLSTKEIEGNPGTEVSVAANKARLCPSSNNVQLHCDLSQTATSLTRRSYKDPDKLMGKREARGMRLRQEYKKVPRRSRRMTETRDAIGQPPTTSVVYPQVNHTTTYM
ncbi:hypothetical protein ElyMa_004986600 [Elysia marginata]|uniref:Uncharacterized protein n=1 Tax=Elysia marginata TaxID=1093978 RepID=A0AAV4J5R0_9GAST|nr:hypothetical protein ElyMa_004986600 [Elysia marginata]